MAHRWSKWNIPEASNLNLAIYYAFHKQSCANNYQIYVCLISQNYHFPHGTPSFMILPTYKFGDDGRCFTMVSTTNTSSCQPLLFSTFQWHTADQIDFLFSRHLLMLLVSSAALHPTFTQIFVALCPEIVPCSCSSSTSSSSSSSRPRPSSRPLARHH